MNRYALSSLLLATTWLSSCHALGAQAGMSESRGGAFGARALPGMDQAEPFIMAGAGDIAYDTPGAEATAKLLDQIPGLVFALGDNCYQTGSPDEYKKYYAPTWGRHLSRTRPAIGNHEYYTPGAEGYWGYFGQLAGTRGQGWYAYDAGPFWRAVVLNSNSEFVGVAAGSPQYEWLRMELTQARAEGKNVLAYWHHPRFSSGHHGDHVHMQPMWELLLKERADLVLSGHDHHYERFKPTNAAGDRDDRDGMASFVVGTGGKNHYAFYKLPKRITAIRNADTFGVMKLTLRKTDFEWEFLPEAGKKFTDRGALPVR